ncbi:MAG TPA: nucleotide disphospho-sugar-binding domain-containing protein [Mycobacterium sp.]
MKILIASTPASGHLNPLLSVGRAAQSQGHEVVALCAHALRDLIEASGAIFRAFPPVADFDLRNVDSEFPGFTDVNPGPDRNLFIVKSAWVDTIPAQHEAMRQVLQYFPADVILADDFLFGALPMLLGPRSERPAIVMLGTMPLHLSRDDGAPPFAGLPPATTAAEREQYKAVHEAHHAAFLGPSDVDLQARLLARGIDPPAMTMFDSTVLLPDAFLQLTAPSFEYPRENLPSSVRCVGALPILANQAPLPPWADDIDGSRKVVLVTQGTLSNHDFTELVAPTLAALAEEPDLLVVATAGGRSTETIPGPIPDNARLADYLPLEWLLPHVDALVSNGGYGTVNQALCHGVPIIIAGETEDKPDVGARVAWSGVGIDLQTARPAPEVLRAAVRCLLDDPRYRRRANILATEFAAVDTTAEILSVLNELAGVTTH